VTAVTEPQYLPGEWVAVVTHDGVALLPATTPPATLRALWDSVRAADAGDLVPHLQVLTEGLTSLPPFALLSVAGRRLHAVVRGAVEVDVTVAGRSRVLSAPHVATWSEEVLDAVERVAVRAPGVTDVPADDLLPLVSGTVHAAAVVLPVDQPLHLAVDAAAALPVTRALPVVAARVPGGVPVAVGVPSPAPAGDEPVEDTLLRPTATESAPSPRLRTATRTAPAPSPVALAAPVPTAVVVDDEPGDEEADDAEPHGARHLALAPAATEAPADAVPLADVLADHDGTTVLSPDVVALRAQLPDWAGHDLVAPAPAAVPAPAPARITLSTGDTVALDRPVLVGRAPQVSRVTSAQVPRLVTVPSPLQDISRTHAEVRMDGDDVVLTDLRSTNGVLVVRPHAAPQRLQPGEATVLQPGVLVDLGEGVTFTVERDA
jgi:resuscitation-promoting factor RpfA